MKEKEKQKEHELSKGQKAYLQRIVNEFKDEAKEVFSDLEKLKNELIDGNDEKYSFEDLENSKKELLDFYNAEFKPLMQLLG
jgi:hypothetical protein